MYLIHVVAIGMLAKMDLKAFQGYRFAILRCLENVRKPTWCP
jgi:hypothetical protein